LRCRYDLVNTLALITAPLYTGDGCPTVGFPLEENRSPPWKENVNWIDTLESSGVISWLLAPDLPSVRYWTLTRLLNRQPDDGEVVETREQILRQGSAAKILEQYAGDGRWRGERDYYTYKYTSTHWQLLLLAELAADGRDERISEACRRMIDEIHRADRPVAWTCFHGNLVGYLNALGHGENERVREFADRLARAGIERKWKCDWNDQLPCAWGAARALWGFSRIPPAQRSTEVREAIEAGVRLLGRFKLREGNYPTATKPHRLWERLNFPLFYQADVLFILRVLADLGQLRSKPTFRLAVRWLEDRSSNNWRWNGVSAYRRRMTTPLEDHGRPSKWVTWQALYIIESLR